MNRRSEVGLADAVRVMRTLPRREWADALATIGYDFVDSRRDRRSPRDRAGDAEPGGVRLEDTLTTVESDLDVDQLPLPPPTRRAGLPQPEPPASGTTAISLERDPPRSFLRRRSNHDPVLPPDTAAPILAAITRSRRGSGGVDVAELTRRIARVRPIAPLPMRTRLRLASRILVFIDDSETMAAFGDDWRPLIDAWRTIMPAESVERHQCPHRLTALLNEVRLRPDDLVVVVTDLGIPPQARLDRRDQTVWERLALAAAEAAAHLIVLVPYPPDRWPVGIADHVPIVQWDPAVSVADIRRANEATQ